MSQLSEKQEPPRITMSFPLFDMCFMFQMKLVDVAVHNTQDTAKGDSAQDRGYFNFCVKIHIWSSIDGQGPALGSMHKVSIPRNQTPIANSNFLNILYSSICQNCLFCLLEERGWIAQLTNYLPAK